MWIIRMTLVILSVLKFVIMYGVQGVHYTLSQLKNDIHVGMWERIRLEWGETNLKTVDWCHIRSAYNSSFMPQLHVLLLIVWSVEPKTGWNEELCMSFWYSRKARDSGFSAWKISMSSQPISLDWIEC